MQNIFFNTNDAVGTKRAIEFRVLDNADKERKIIVLFDAADDWMKAYKPTSMDKAGFFKGAITQLLNRDSSVSLIEAKTYTVQNNKIGKPIAFTPQIKINGCLKECFIGSDGIIEIL